MKTATDEQLTRRFYVLNFGAAIVLLAAIVLSIYQFGAQAWSGKQQIGFIMPGNRDNAGWYRAQYEGIAAACKELGYELLIRENVPTDRESSINTVKELTERGANVIFFIDAEHLRGAENYTVNISNVRFYSINNNPYVNSIFKYSVSQYEQRYVAGMLAGLRTKTNRVGYIAPFPNSDINLNINAFTLGAQRVNPNATVLVGWTSGYDNKDHEEQIVRNLKAERVDVLTFNQNGDTIPKAAERAGIYFIAANENYPNMHFCLGAIKTDWKNVYLDILRHDSRHSYYFANTADIKDKSRTDAEFVKNKLTPRELALMETTRYEIKKERLIFAGEIYDRNGMLRSKADEAISNKYFQKQMDWLAKGVIIIGN